MTVTDLAIRRNEARIPWWYGLSHRDLSMRAEIWLPVPLNFVVRNWLSLTDVWDRFRSTPSRAQLAIEIALRDERAAGFAAGEIRGWKRCLRHAGEAISLLGTLSDNDFADRARRYDYEPPDEVKAIIPFWKDR